MKRLRPALGTAALLLGLAAGAPEARADAPTPAPFRLDVKRARLDNGLRVVLLVDHTSPTVAIDVVYDVGARNEERGRTGFAHLVEHLMFQGSRNVARGDHARLVTARGGVLDGATSHDLTSYFEVLPSSELSLGLWLEADRMRSLEVAQANLDAQRRVVRDEHTRTLEGRPYAAALLRADALVYQGFFPYEHDLTGATRDLDAARLGAVRAFHDAYYAPNNAVLVVAGDVDEADALALVRRWFGDIPARADAPRYAPPPVPEQVAPRFAIVEDPIARAGAAVEGWLIPAAREADHPALELAAALLGDGEGARLPRLLVHDRAVATRAEVSVEGRRGPDRLQVLVTLASGAKVDQVTKLVDGVLADLARSGPTDDEMKKLRNRARSRSLLGLQSNLDRARAVAALEIATAPSDTRDAPTLDGELAKLLAVSKDDIRRVTARYLTTARRTLVEVKPGASR